MILIEFLLAPTVPSAPSPKNRAWCMPASAGEKSLSQDKLVWVTSSMIPMVKWFLGCLFFKLSRTALAMPGLNSLEPRP